jgi:hypothetical protein
MRTVKRAGMTLISALAFTVVVGTILAGVATVTASHYGRAEIEGDYANAIALADAGLNFELMHISRDTSNSNLPHQEDAPFVGSVPGVPGTYTVFVRDWNNGACNSGTFDPAVDNEVCVVSTGTINGISRTVIAQGLQQSVFGEYAIYAIQSGQFNGAGASGGSTSVIGNMGTNGEVQFNGQKETDTVVGELHLNGPDSSSDDDGGNVITSPDPVEWPTVEEVANSLFPGGLTWLANNNNNASIRRFNSINTALASETTLAGFTKADFESMMVLAGFNTSSRNFNDPANSTPSASNAIDAAGSGTRFVMPADVPNGTVALGIQGKRTLFVPPGDYYFTNMRWTSGQNAVVFLTHLCGQNGYPNHLRIWIDEGGGNDRFQSTPIFTDPDPKKFRFYYNKCDTFQMDGNSQFRGSMYGVKDGCNAGLPSFDFNGNSRVYGAVIANDIRVSGATKIIFPNNGGGVDDDFPLWFGFGNGWKEIPTFSGRPVFVDGTSK